MNTKSLLKSILAVCMCTLGVLSFVISFVAQYSEYMKGFYSTFGYNSSNKQI